MSSRSMHIHAPVSVVHQLLMDVGGWRIWNRSIAFSAIDGDAKPQTHGLLYLRRLAWLQWQFLIIEQQPLSKLTLDCVCLGVHMHINHQMTALSADQTLLRIDISPQPHVLSRLFNIAVMRYWFDYQQHALKGIGYAAQQVYAASMLPKA
jgi:hypothetical protein